MKKIVALIVCLSFGFLLFANGEQEVKEEVKKIESMNWDEIVAQAKAEGELTWFQWYFQPEFREFVKAFEAEYGIKVTVADGSLDGNVNKLLGEYQRTTGDIDVISLGGDVADTLNMQKYFCGPLTSMIPDGKKLRTAIMGCETNGYGVAFWGNQTGLAYDSTKISEKDLPQDIEALSDWMAKNPKQLGFNVENGGSGPFFVQAIVRNTVSGVDFASGDSGADKVAKLSPAWKWLNDRSSQYILTASNADSLTRLNDGEFTIVPTWEDFLAGLQNKNTIDKRIKFYIPEFGMNGGGNLVSVAANAPHKAAAILFVSWLTSADVQAKLNQVFGSAPQHPESNSEFALIPIEQRRFSTDAMKAPLCDDLKNAFVEEVVLK